jgi:hypothetical protein
MLLNLVLATALVGPLDVQGLGLALSIAAGAEFLGLLVLFSRKVPGIAQGTGLWSALGRLTISGGFCAAAFIGMRLLLEGAGGLEVKTWADAVIITVLAGGLGSLVYLVATLAMGLREPWLIARRLPFLGWLVPASFSSD